MKTDSNKIFFKHLPVTIVFPVILSVILFISTIFLLVIPYLESSLMQYRRHLVHNLTEVAISTLEFYDSQHKSGKLTLEQAQDLAREHIKNLRYGSEHKDYFWINNMHPIMIMHPYRPDLNGKDITDFKDPLGKKLFVEMVNVARKNGSGFVDYEWQWKDDPFQIVPKLSFVKEYTPWKWIIGTGIYINDIREEISEFTKQLTIICSVICLTLFLLSFYIISQGIKVEKERDRAEEQFRCQQEQLYQTAKLASVGTLVSGVAHEINNPTTSLLLNAPLLKKMWHNLLPLIEDNKKQAATIAGMPLSLVKERIPKLLDHIEEGSRRIKNIVSELKDFARITPSEHGDSVDLNLATQKAVSLVANMIHKQTDHLKIDYAENLPIFKGNFQKIEQAIINLVVNAGQALTDKSQSITIATSFDQQKQEVSLIVKDQGKGIPEDILTHIRDPFFTTKQNQGNTGLGLAITERIVNDHKGTMTFDSRLNEGTTVQLSFPVTPNFLKPDYERSTS